MWLDLPWFGVWVEMWLVQGLVFNTHLLAAQLWGCQKGWSWCGMITIFTWIFQEFNALQVWQKTFQKISHGWSSGAKNCCFLGAGQLADVAHSDVESSKILLICAWTMCCCLGFQKFWFLVERWSLKVQNFPTQTLVIILGIFQNLGNFQWLTD